MATDAKGLLDFLLEKRGMKTAEEKQKFLNPEYDSQTHDPFFLKDVEKAIERIYQAVKNNERIAVFSDYDADGIPGAVIAKSFLDKISHKNFEIYIPHRHDEGFGLNHEAVDELIDRGAKLLITIDCGTADRQEISYAMSKNLDVIITDHHEPPVPTYVGTGGSLTFAIVNPKQKDCNYPEKNICGSAVIFKVIQAFLSKYGKEFNVPLGWEKWLLDMVAIATLSDMMPLLGENRNLAHYGLLVLRKTPRPGLNALFEKLRLSKKNLTEDDVGFSIIPRINAASRMGTPDDAFNLLSATENDDVSFLLDKIEHVNNERKGTVASLVKEVRKIVNERDNEGRKLIVLGNPNWRPSLLGLAANAFAGEFSCPVFLWGRDGGNIIKGSVRSGGSVNVMNLMQAVRPGIFTEFGGHAFSGGFTLSNESVHSLERELEVAFSHLPSPEVSESDDLYDSELGLDDVSLNTYDILSKLAPFGVGNPKPKFLFRNVSVVSVKNFGKEKNHIEIVLKKTSGNTKAIQFFASDDFEDIKEGQKISFVGSMEKSTFGNRTELRLRIHNFVK